MPLAKSCNKQHHGEVPNPSGHRSTGCPRPSGNRIPCSCDVWGMVCGSLWQQDHFLASVEIRKKLSVFTGIQVTSTPTWKLLCLDWKRCCHIFHLFIGHGLKIRASGGCCNLGPDGLVGCSFCSKRMIDCDSFYTLTDDNFNVSPDINILQL